MPEALTTWLRPHLSPDQLPQYNVVMINHPILVHELIKPNPVGHIQELTIIQSFSSSQTRALNSSTQSINQKIKPSKELSTS